VASSYYRLRNGLDIAGSQFEKEKEKPAKDSLFG